MAGASKREERIAAGLDAISGWLREIARDGWGHRDPESIDTVARRLVDAQLPGLARRVWRLAEVEEDPEEVARRIGWLHLLVQAFLRSGAEEPIRPDLEANLGLSLRKATVLAEGERVEDRFLCLGSIDEDLDPELRTRRTWLLGLQSGTPGVVIEFWPSFRPPPSAPVAGGQAQGAIAFYPSATPTRCLFDGEWDRFQPARCPGAERWLVSLSEAWERRRIRWERNPFAAPPLVGVDGLRLVDVDGLAFLADSDGRAVRVDPSHRAWLLAIGATAPVGLWGELDRDTLHPVAAWVEGYVPR